MSRISRLAVQWRAAWLPALRCFSGLILRGRPDAARRRSTPATRYVMFASPSALQVAITLWKRSASSKPRRRPFTRAQATGSGRVMESRIFSPTPEEPLAAPLASSASSAHWRQHANDRGDARFRHSVRLSTDAHVPERAQASGSRVDEPAPPTARPRVAAPRPSPAPRSRGHRTTPTTCCARPATDHPDRRRSPRGTRSRE